MLKWFTCAFWIIDQNFNVRSQIRARYRGKWSLLCKQVKGLISLQIAQSKEIIISLKKNDSWQTKLPGSLCSKVISLSKESNIWLKLYQYSTC